MNSTTEVELINNYQRSVRQYCQPFPVLPLLIVIPVLGGLHLSCKEWHFPSTCELLIPHQWQVLSPLFPGENDKQLLQSLYNNIIAYK